MMETTNRNTDLDEIAAPISSDEENIIIPKKSRRKKLLIDSDEDDSEAIASDTGKDIEEDLEEDSEADDEDVSLSAEDGEDELDDESGDDAEDDEDDENESSDACSVLSFDSEFSWNEFGYVEDDVNNSFIQDEEENLRERYNAAMKLLLSEQAEEGFDSLTILYEEPLIQKQFAPDFLNFDWEKAKSQYIKSCEPKMRTIAFGVTRALARFAKDPIIFYLQALSLRPTDKALWYEFGCTSARLHNWKTAELAFKQCLNDSDSKVKLAIVYFYSKDYHKCLPLLHDALIARSNNLALLVLKSEITKINNFWKFFVELYFPSNPFFFPQIQLPQEVYEKVLKEIQNFTSQQPLPQKFCSPYSIDPLPAEPIRINIEQSAEAFAKFLCLFFDQSTKQQIPFHQNIHFAKERRHHHHSSNRNLFNSSMSSSCYKEPSPIRDVEMVVDEVVNAEIENVCKSFLDDTVAIVTDVEKVVEKLIKDVVDGKIPKSIKPKRRITRKKPNLSLDVRRSTRRAEEIPFEAMDSPLIGTFPTTSTSNNNNNSEPITIRTLLGFPTGDSSSFPPLDFPGASGFPLDNLSYEFIPSFSLETFGTYLTTLINKQILSLEELLKSFLLFFSTNLPEGCKMTLQQQKLFLEIYIRWIQTFCQPFYQHCFHASVKEISIHLLALELDVHEKLVADEACQIAFGRLSGLFISHLEDESNLAEAQNVVEDTSVKTMRKKAINLLSEADPQMAARIKSCMEETRTSAKALMKEANIGNAIENLSFVGDAFRQRSLKGARPKPKKQNTSILESPEQPPIDSMDTENFDLTTLEAIDLCIPSTSNQQINILPKISETYSKFISLWNDLSKIMQRIKPKKQQSSERQSSSASNSREISPMDENEMLSLLNECSSSTATELEGINEMFFESLKTIGKNSLNREDVNGLLKEYISGILENFVKDFRFKKEVDEDAAKRFLDETKKAIEVMNIVLSENIDDEEEENMEIENTDNEKLRELVVRYYWLRLIRLKNIDGQSESNFEEERKAYLSTMLHLMDPNKPLYTQLADDNGKYAVVTAKEISAKLTKIFREEKIKNIHKLFEGKDYHKVISEFTSDFNWHSCNEKEIVSNLRLLLDSFDAVEDRKGPVEWICRLLDRVISGKFEEFRDDIYHSCLQQLEQLDFDEIEHDFLRLVAKRLVVFAEYDRFKKNIKLWKILYRIASVLEGSYIDEENRIEMYQEIEGFRAVMPTKGLCLLVEAHHVLGQENHCCSMDMGELLFFFIDEVYKHCLDYRCEEHYYSKMIQRNVELQLIQCLKCLFDPTIGKSVVYDHESDLSLTPTLSIARKVRPFLIPKLPMFDDEKFATNDVIEALTRVFPFIEDERIAGFDEALSEFEIFLKNPPFFKFISNNNELQPIGGGGEDEDDDDLEKAYKWPCVELNDENREKLELFSYVRYVLLVIKYKKQSYSWDENEKLRQLTKECLVLVGPSSRNLLPPKIIHSLWALCAYTNTMHFCNLDDEELAQEANTYFYMFKMAFLNYSHAFQLHIDIAVAYYQINTRLRRHKKALKEKSFPPEVESKIEKEAMIEQCQLHFNQFRYRISQTNEYPKDISWIEAYFSGKIAEHSIPRQQQQNRRRLSPEDVFAHYYRCAKLMRDEAYTYPLRVNKTTQENVEPLEIHYRVHVFALKQLYEMENIKSVDERMSILRCIRHYLITFLGHFIFAKKNQQPPIPAIETKFPFIDSTPTCDFDEDLLLEDEGEVWYEDPVERVVDSMLSYVEVRNECMEYCRRAFETIVKRFPHYKSYYQIALLHLRENNFKLGLDTIFSRLFKGKFVSFEKVTEIERTDIERSDTLLYHVKKLIQLTIGLLRGCRDWKKTQSVLEDLAKDYPNRIRLKSEDREIFIGQCLDIFSIAVKKVMKEKNIDECNSLIKALEKARSTLRSNKKLMFDERLQQLITRCQNTIRHVNEARDKQQQKVIQEQREKQQQQQQKALQDLREKQQQQRALQEQQQALQNQQNHQTALQLLMELQRRAVEKQKQDLEEKIKQKAEEERKKQQEEQKRQQKEEAEKKQKNFEEQRRVLLQKIMDENKKTIAENTKKENIKKINEAFADAVIGSKLSTQQKLQIVHQKPAIIKSCLDSLEKGTSLENVIGGIAILIRNMENQVAAAKNTKKAPAPSPNNGSTQQKKSSPSISASKKPISNAPSKTQPSAGLQTLPNAQTDKPQSSPSISASKQSTSNASSNTPKTQGAAGHEQTTKPTPPSISAYKNSVTTTSHSSPKAQENLSMAQLIALATNQQSTTSSIWASTATSNSSKTHPTIGEPQNSPVPNKPHSSPSISAYKHSISATLNSSKAQERNVPTGPQTASMPKLPTTQVGAEPQRASSRPTPPSRATLKDSILSQQRAPSIKKSPNPNTNQQSPRQNLPNQVSNPVVAQQSPGPNQMPANQQSPRPNKPATQQNFRPNQTIQAPKPVAQQSPRPSQPPTPSNNLPATASSSNHASSAGGEPNRFTILGQIEELIKKYDSKELPSFYSKKKDFLGWTTSDLERLHSQLLIRYMTQKSPSSNQPTMAQQKSSPSSNPTIGNKRPPSNSPSKDANVATAAKIRKTTPTTIHGMPSLSSGNKDAAPTTTATMASKKNATPGMPSLISTAANVSAATKSTKAPNFQYLTDQVKKAIPQQQQSSSSKTFSSADDDEITILCEKIMPKNEKAIAAASKASSSKPSETNRKMSDVVNIVIASTTTANENSSSHPKQIPPPQQPSTSKPQTNPFHLTPRPQPSMPKISSKPSQTPNVSHSKLSSSNAQRSNVSSSSSSASTNSSTPTHKQRQPPSSAMGGTNNNTNQLLLQQQMQMFQNGQGFTEERRQLLEAFLRMNQKK